MLVLALNITETSTGLIYAGKKLLKMKVMS